MKKFLSLIFSALVATSFAAPPTSTGPLTNAYNTTDQDFRGHKALNLDTSNLSIGGGGGGGGAGLTQITLNAPSILLASPINFSIVGTVATATMTLSSAPPGTIFANLSGGGAQPTWATIAALKSAGQLDLVDNNHDLDKPISNATQAQLDLKESIASHATDVTALNTAIALKVNISDNNTAMANKADLASTTSALASKASNSDLTSGLAGKQNTWGLPGSNGFIAAGNTSGTLFWVDPTSLGTTSQSYTDGQSFTNTNYDSLTAAFVSTDIGKTITGTDIPSSTTIVSVTSATRVVLSNATTGTHGPGNVFTILNRLSGSTGAGTVTVVTTGNPAPIFHSSIASGSSTPAISYTLDTQLADTFFGNPSGSTLAPVFMSAAQARNILANSNLTGAALMSLTDASAIRYIKINANNSVTLDSASTFLTDIGAEPALGNPSTNGFVLSSTTSGTRSWIANGAPLTFTSPLVNTSNTISIPSASASASGYLLASDWSTFNAKESPLTFNAPLVRASNTIALPIASAGSNGYLTSSDWIVFSNKAPSSRNIFTTPPISGGGDMTADRTISMTASASGVDGYLKGIDFARMFRDISQGSTTDTVMTWTNGNTDFMESTPLTLNRVRTLPATSAYAEGSVIRYTDNVTTAVAGPIFLPGGSDTLKGQNSTTWTATTLGGYQPFRGGGFNGGSKSITFQKRGADWQIYELGGESLSIKSIQNPNNFSGIATIDASPLLSAQTITIPNSPQAVIPVPSGINANNVLFGLNTNGIFTQGPFSPFMLVPSIYTIGSTGNSIASGSTFPVTNDGTIDTIVIAGSLNGPITATLPSASLYSPQDQITIIDLGGSLSSANTLTLLPNGTDKINNLSSSSATCTEANGKRFISSDGSVDWSIPAEKATASSGYAVLTAGANNTFTLITNPTAGGSQKANITLINGVNNLSIPNPSDGMSFDIVLVQPASGSGTLNLPVGSAVGGGNAGLITLSATPNAVDRLLGVYNAPLGEFMFTPPGLNYTTAALPSAPTTLVPGTITSTSIQMSWTDNSSNETSFDIERSTDGGTSFNTIATNAPNVATFTDSSLTPGFTYLYKVRAGNTGGYSVYTNTITQATTASCSTSGDVLTTPNTSATGFAQNSGNTYMATVITVGAGNGSVCRITTAIDYQAGSANASQFLKAEIRADAGGATAITGPATSALFTSTNSYTGGAVLANATTPGAAGLSPLNFTFSGVSLTVGNTYWIVVHSTDVAGTGQVFDTTGKHPNWNNVSSGLNPTKKSGDGVTWVNNAANQKFNVTTYH
jgi:hypothetical protein